jgi:hypothetical protein
VTHCLGAVALEIDPNACGSSHPSVTRHRDVW